MPRATVDKETTHHYDLQSLDGGFVELRKLDFGQMQHRQEMAAEMAMKTEGKGRKGSTEAIVKMMQRVVTDYEFANCVADHNLEDEQGNKLNFSQPGVVARLDPRIGDEISQLIDSLNKFEDALGESTA